MGAQSRNEPGERRIDSRRVEIVEISETADVTVLDDAIQTPVKLRNIRFDATTVTHVLDVRVDMNANRLSHLFNHIVVDASSPTLHPLVDLPCQPDRETTVGQPLLVTSPALTVTVDHSLFHARHVSSSRFTMRAVISSAIGSTFNGRSRGNSWR